MGGLASISFVRLSYWGKQPAAAADVERAPTNKCRGIVKKQQQGQHRPRSTDCDKSRLLFNVSGSVRRGEMVAVMGPSGSGKTTLLRLLGGHTRTGAMAGHRRINGKDLAAKTYEAVLRQHSGFVEQSDATMLGEWNLTVWETVAYASLLRLPTGTSLSARLDRTSEVVRSLGLDLCANTVVSGKKGGSSRRPVGGDDRRNRGGNTRRSSDAGGGNGEGGGQISGGQLRRLQIALEMLRSPGALFLDEPTSGLDSASSLVLVSRLSDLSKASAVGSEAPPPMVVATIHQPRADVLALFDVLLLLKEGRLVYAGRPSDCGPHFASIPQVALNPATYENPADFVMDSLDARNLRPFICSFTTRRSLLEKTDDGEDLSLTSGLSVKNLSNRGTHSRGAIEMTSSNFGMEESFGLIPDDGEERKLSDSEQSQESSSEEDETKPMLASSAAAPAADYSLRSIAGRLRVAMHTTMRRFEWSRHGPDFNCSEDDDASSNHVPPAEGLVEAFEKSSFLFHAHNMRLDERQQNESLAVQSEGRQKSGGGSRVSSSSASSPNSLVLSEQTIVLFTRRTHRQMVDWQGIVVSHLQVLGIATTVAFAFSYDVDDSNQAVGVPYQAYMCLLLTSSYAFMNSYFLLPSEYLDERPLVEAERLRGHLRFESYLTATFLGELPRGFWHVVLTLGPAYLVHGLNPSSTSRCFAVVCLAVGVAAWQGVICICAAATTNVTAATLLAFLFFGGGTLFGGLLIEYENIPMIFRPAYHLSVTAVTQRALIVNDFICCYITLPCGGAGNSGDHGGGKELFGGNDGAVHFSTQALSTAASYLGVSRGSDEPACPEGVDEHQGNLGRKALELLGLDGVDDYAALATLFIVAIASRVVALLVLKQRERWGRRLHSHHAPSASVQKQAV
jgi:ABC-type multidrug transport system ATPase subunit